VTAISAATSSPPGRGGRRISAAERRESIVVAARAVFTRVGQRGARMRTIAATAGVTEPTLYRHFGSRDELFQVAVEQHLTDLLDTAAARAEELAGEEHDDRAALIHTLSSVYLQVMSDIAPLAAVALYEDGTRGRAFYQSVVRPRLRTVAAALYRATTGGPLPAGMENVVAVALFGVPFGVALDGMLRGRPVDLEAMSERIARLFR
jgi:AcrR family transcriptional regulator